MQDNKILIEFIEAVKCCLNVRYRSGGSWYLTPNPDGSKMGFILTRSFTPLGETAERKKVYKLPSMTLEEISSTAPSDFTTQVFNMVSANAKDIAENPDELVGKHGYFMWTGSMVGGTITKVTVSAHSVDFEYDMDQPHVWGSDTYRRDFVWGRLPDNFGPLQWTVFD